MLRLVCLVVLLVQQSAFAADSSVADPIQSPAIGAYFRRHSSLSRLASAKPNIFLLVCELSIFGHSLQPCFQSLLFGSSISLGLLSDSLLFAFITGCWVEARVIPLHRCLNLDSPRAVSLLAFYFRMKRRPFDSNRVIATAQSIPHDQKESLLSLIDTKGFSMEIIRRVHAQGVPMICLIAGLLYPARAKSKDKIFAFDELRSISPSFYFLYVAYSAGLHESLSARDRRRVIEICHYQLSRRSQGIEKIAYKASPRRLETTAAVGNFLFQCLFAGSLPVASFLGLAKEMAEDELLYSLVIKSWMLFDAVDESFVGGVSRYQQYCVENKSLLSDIKDFCTSDQSLIPAQLREIFKG